MSSKQAQDMAGLRCFLNELYELLELKVEDVKMKLSSVVVVVIVLVVTVVGGGGCDVIVVVVLVVATGP
jgi:hypothetical protein